MPGARHGVGVCFAKLTVGDKSLVRKALLAR